MKEFKIFLKPGEKLEEHKETDLDIVDTATQEALHVKAVVSQSFQTLPAADRLWLQATGTSKLIHDQPWAIRIIEIDEEKAEPIVVTKQKISLGRMKGSILETLIRERSQGEPPKT